MTQPELAIILPVYNEGEAVEPVLRALSAAVMTPHELVVVYDFDGDTTVPVVARLAGEIPGLRGLRNDLGRGVLNAMKAGIAGTTRVVPDSLCRDVRLCVFHVEHLPGCSRLSILWLPLEFASRRHGSTGK